MRVGVSAFVCETYRGGDCGAKCVASGVCGEGCGGCREGV